MEKALLQVEEVTKRFGGLTAVNQVSMHVKQGETVGLIGANGAGKTTLFNLIAGAYHVTSGRILFEGKEIQNMPSHKLARIGIARTYQIVKPFSNLTMLENTMVGALQKHSRVEEARRKAEEVLELVEMGDRKNVRGENLNLPELKRMEVARALATEPKILLLDEVMAGLNPTDSGRVINLIRKIGKESGLTIIIIEHVMKAVMTLSDRVYVLNQGCLIADGSPEEVTADPEVIKSYLGEKRYAKN
ncbi:ABC transporter ATP-binding protein [[Clostridium] symbiosum]|nr:ABC transporter ATP-binding protein [[Clostridium] symbiosum]MBT9786961.1 ATP-binding cassette domain-containing protein [[Clostridium] symbiosum]NSF84259.1 ABC transporter ATP-binding protein [[Clostridium] symbiosum]NSJ00990.1 ABC transporter ATP-binding protein [[Clostridium] symbiosum]RGY50135.1 ABC transporter ATP-binding protein [[Clostridium] symbiosum]